MQPPRSQSGRRRALAAGVVVIVGVLMLGCGGCTGPTGGPRTESSGPDPAGSISRSGPTPPTSTVGSKGAAEMQSATMQSTEMQSTEMQSTVGEPPGPTAGTTPPVTPPAPDPAITTAGTTTVGTSAVGTSTITAGTTTVGTSTNTTGTPGFHSTVNAVDAARTARMTRSWRSGCPVALVDLRYLTVTYRSPVGDDRTGELVVAASVADDVVTVFHRLYDAGFPITSMRLVDDFDADDDASMAADNTSAFNCRPVTGGGGFSEHSYGTAVDVNPLQNPYVRGSTVLPPAGRDFVDRPDSPGVIHPGDATVAAFAAIGWSWGGDWATPTDYQHFSLSGR